MKLRSIFPRFSLFAGIVLASIVYPGSFTQSIRMRLGGPQIGAPGIQISAPTPQTVQVAGVVDIQMDGEITYSIINAPAPSDDPTHNGLDAANLTLVNQADDDYGVIITPTSGLVTSEDGTSASFTVILKTLPSENVTIHLSSSDTSEGTVLPNKLTFTEANWNVTQTATVNGIDDSMVDGDIAYTVVTRLNSKDSHYRNINPPDVSLTNLDNDAYSPPTATPDTFSLEKNMTLTIQAPGVLSNDTNPSGNPPLTAQLVNTVSHGSLTLNANGSFAYTPAQNYTGQDSFTYQATSAGLASNTATVTLTIQEVNRAPVASNDSYLTNKVLGVTAANGLLKNDSDADGNPLKITSNTLPSSGTLMVNPDGSFTYTPTSGFDGAVTFTYRVSDGQALSQPATVSIRVDITPPAPIQWVAPVATGAVYYITSGSVTVEVQLSSPTPDMSKVIFLRWDPDLGRRVELGSQSIAPYRIKISIINLKVGWNQIDATAVDLAGNASTFQHIWLVRRASYYLPVLSK